MNKKFSTLLAGMALLSVMSVNAQEGVTTTPAAVDNTIPALAKATSVSKLKEGVNTELYQLKVGKGVLAMDKEGKLYVETGTLTSSNMANTLWCVTVATQQDGQAPKFDFENRATGMILDIAMSGVKDENTWYTAQTGGDVSGWAFSRSYKVMEENKALFSYVDSEYVLGFKIADDGKTVQVAKVKATAYNRDENKYTANGKTENNYFVPFTLKSPAEIFLSADELNKIFDTYTDAKHGLKLNFDKDVLGTDIPNPFNAQSFYTESAETISGMDVDGNVISNVPYLFVRQKDKETYLRVDTAYTNEKGVPFLAYKWNSDWVDVDQNGKKTEYEDAKAYLADSDMKNQYKFLFRYSPKDDNLYIYIHTVTNKDINDSKAYWYASKDKGYNGAAA